MLRIKVGNEFLQDISYTQSGKDTITQINNYALGQDYCLWGDNEITVVNKLATYLSGEVQNATIDPGTSN